MSTKVKVSVPGFDAEMVSLLAEEFDGNHLRPKNCVIEKMTELVHGAMSDGLNPSVAVITFGDGGLRLLCGEAPNRNIALDISPNEGPDGYYHPAYIRWDGEGRSGLVDDVDAAELRKWFEWVVRER